jgi:hypothetical protein
MYDIARIAGLFVSFSAVSAGFAFNAIVFLLRWTAGEDADREAEISRQRALLILLVAMSGFLFTAFAYATVHGFSGTPATAWLLAPLAAMSLSASLGALYFGIVLLFRSHRLDYAARLAAGIYDVGLLFLVSLVVGNAVLSFSEAVYADRSPLSLPLTAWAEAVLPALPYLVFTPLLTRNNNICRVLRREAGFRWLLRVTLAAPFVASLLATAVVFLSPAAPAEAMFHMVLPLAVFLSSLALSYSRLSLHALMSAPGGSGR